MKKVKTFVPGVKGTPVFKSWEEFDEWRSRQYNKIKSKIEKQGHIRLCPKNCI